MGDVSLFQVRVVFMEMNLETRRHDVIVPHFHQIWGQDILLLLQHFTKASTVFLLS